MTTPLPVLLISDGRPGHYNLAEGIVEAARSLRPVQVTRLEVRRGGWPGAVLAAWSNSRVAPARLLRTVFGIEASRLPATDLVVSAGAETLAANIACARLLGASNVFYGSLRSFKPAAFSLALTSYVEDCRQPNQAFALKPAPAAIAAWTARRQRPTESKTIGLLIGGPSGEAEFSDQDWEALIRLIDELGRSGYRWLVANSRRTPPEISDRIAALAAADASPIELFIDARFPDAPSLRMILEDAAIALVTDESSSMVSEAVGAGLPVIGLAPQDQRLHSREMTYRVQLQQHGWYRSLALATAPGELLATAATLTPRTENPAASIAELLRRQLPVLFDAASQRQTRPPAR